MNKGLAITGGVLLFVSILVNVISIVSVADYRPTNENILHDTSNDGTTFEYDGDAITMEVYAKSDTANCFNYEISVTDSMNQDVFISNCDGTDFPSYTYLGDLADISAGTYTITSEGDIVIVDASEIVAPVMGLCGGSVCCLLGLILLIVGLVSGRKTPQVVLLQQPGGQIYQPNQTTVQQYIPPAMPAQNPQPQSTVVQQETTQEGMPMYQSEFDGFSFEHKKDE
ncbi:MAG: hypothetical protein ACPGQN_04780 [Candidatus Poseidoniaceae archaeon]